ncbi:WD40/YVTN/BNR-like repeat-containing protein [Chitinophaga silvisoli]|uniref:Exo-alpha-sialidase n=1 Tax=Chitinophaga silvisoli TaxID=2291814 RepID=A0A3E1NSL7_9BACT|nr:sialidase family protein [Chitinophaga silvisoli]RFM30925.1 exo-alpha-sialidase [Chitinophaga silvisoli]
MKIVYHLAILLLSQCLFSCNQVSEMARASITGNSLQSAKTNTSGTAKIVFKTTDGGQTWQDISKGLPENLQGEKIRGNSFFANDKGLFLRVGNGLYHSVPNATAPFWTKEISPDEHSSMASPKSGIFGFNYWGINLKKTNGTSVWSPIFENFQEPRIRSAFETTGGTIFVGTDRGFFKTADNGETWKQVHTGSLVGNMAEANGVLLAISMKRIIRSTDNGESWSVVSNEGSVAFDVKKIKGGFAAITSGSESGNRGLSTSYDGGKTWQPIEPGLQNKGLVDSIWRTWNNRPRVKASMTPIIQVGENFFCTHPDGIFRSSDKGKTWKLLLPSVEDKVFNLYVSGNVIYAIPSRGGC